MLHLRSTPPSHPTPQLADRIYSLLIGSTVIVINKVPVARWNQMSGSSDLLTGTGCALGPGPSGADPRVTSVTN